MTVEPITPPPNPVFDLLTSLAECLCAQIVADGSPETCFCGVIPGEAAVQQYAGDCNDKCGMAWVRLSSMYPASGVGIPSETVGNCSASLGFDVEIGVTRCIDVGDAYGPTPGELLSITEQQIRDAMTMWRAVNCCPSLSSKDFIMGTYAPMGPRGGMVGGTYTLSLVV